MGFRSTLITEHYDAVLPQWLEEKYNKELLFIDGTLIASRREFKIYNNQIFEDIQKALIESSFFEDVLEGFEMNIAVLAEDGVISKVVITKNSIKYYHLHDGEELGHVWMEGD